MRFQVSVQAYTARLLRSEGMIAKMEPFELELKERWAKRVAVDPIDFVPGPRTALGRVHARMRGWEEKVADERRKATGNGDLNGK